ncbi:MAG TPA: PAS domain-containing sensor histidine kinase [Anaeromyxobacter sp.]|nr:PAS domain-containing sensor histidine kinase [Anaeromyxobacter sp.]
MPSEHGASLALIPAGYDLFRLMVECVIDYAIFMLDPGGHVSSWNVGAHRLKGYRAEEILGRHFSIFYPPEEVAAGKPEQELKEAVRDGRFEDEGWRVRQDGSRFWANVVITAMRDRDGTLRGFGKVTRDLTARRAAEEARRELAAREAAEAERARSADVVRRSEERFRAVAEEQRRTIRELRRAEEEARQIGRLQEQLMAIVGHDLRTPLSVIHLGVASVLSRGGLSPEQQATLGRVARSAQRMRGIIEDLLDFSRARQGLGIPVKKGPVDLAEISRRAIAELGPLSGGRTLSLSVQGDTSLQGDAGRLLQVVSNLVGNAVQHGSGGVEVEVVGGGPDQVFLAVHNRGAIPEQMLPQVFEPFRRGRSVGGSGSVGLGLFIVREVVRAHGGEVEVRSDEAAGTTFTVRLPRGSRAAAEPPAARH